MQSPALMADQSKDRRGLPRKVGVGRHFIDVKVKSEVKKEEMLKQKRDGLFCVIIREV